jgi:hypothetical protein
MKPVAIVIALMVGQAEASGQTVAPADRLALLAPLVGRWSGTRFVQVKNVSVYPPQAKNPKGERHEDLGVFSYDTARKTIVFRQFHVEGFVNQYLLDAASSPDRLVFTTEAIENIPAGWRARETYVIGTDRLEEIFELAEPGQDFAVYSRNRLTRVR